MPNTGIIATYRSGVDLVVEWKIENFFTLSETDGAGYSSSVFSFNRESWYLGIFGNCLSRSSGHVDLRLTKCYSDRICKWTFGPAIEQTFSLSLKTAKGEKYNEQHFTLLFANDYSVHAFNRFIPISALSRRRSELVPEGVLTVICTMEKLTSARSDRNDKQHTYVRASAQRVRASTQRLGASAQRVGASTQCVGASTQTVETSTQHVGPSTQRVGASTQTVETSTQTVEEKYEATASGYSTNSQEKKALHDFKELFLKKEDCDVTIKVKNLEFPTHRVILKARSPVLASTFRHDMKESATGVLQIDDCDPSSFSDFLCFLYCADVQLITQKSVFDLFTLADKYQVLDLRSKCLEFMKNNLTVDTFCETITLALRHSETDLIKLSTDYFTKNAPKIIVTVKWQTFLAENPTESNELFIKLLVPNSS